ncbi:MAK10-like protein, partial [Tanacetum coccineum]
NNVVPLRSDTIRLVQSGCSFHGLRSEDPNQHLKDFLKLVDSLDLDGANRERMRMRLFQFSLRDQASNWLELLPAGSITTWEDLTTRFLAQFFPLGRTAKLHNDILMFQQHHEESLSEAWTCFKDLLQKVPHHGIDLWLQVQIFYDHVNPVTRLTIDQSAGGKLRDRNTEESWALLEDLALYDNESWNDLRDFAKLVKAITLPQDVPSTSDRRLIELENQVQRLIEAHLALTQPTQVNRITTPCEICSGPYDTYLRTQLEQNQDDMISKINLLWMAFSEKLDDAPLCDTAEGLTAQMNFTSTDYHTKEELRSKGIKNPSKLLSPKYLSQSSIIEQNKNPSSLKRVHFVNSIIILNKESEAKEEGSVEPSKTNYTNRKNANETDKEVESEKEVEEETEGETEEEEEDNPEHFETFPTMKELRYHEWLLKNPRPPWVKAMIRTENVNNMKFSCMIGQFNKEQVYLDLESPINIMSRLHYNWIMSNRLEPRRKPSNPKKNFNFVGRVKGLRVFIGNFTYECDFMVLEDTTSVIDHYLRSVVFRKLFVEATGLVYNKEEGTVVFERDKERIIFKMPHTMDMFKHVDFTDRGTNNIPPFVIESDDDNCKKTHYSDSLDLGPEYKYNEYVCKGIQSLMAAKARRKNKREVTTWMAFRGNTRDLGSFREEIDEITDLHQILEEVLVSEHGDGVACIKQRRHDLSGDGVWILATASQRSRLEVDLEPSTW